MELEKLKMLLGFTISNSDMDNKNDIKEEDDIDNSYLINQENDTIDVILEFIIADIEEIIKNYCHVDEVPEGLLNTSYRMAIDLYRNENIGNEDSPTGSVASINEGDTSVSFRQYVDDNFKETLLKNYSKTLNRYRKLVF
jgi:hypothetical protein